MSHDLTLANLESYDPQARSGPVQRRFLCPFCGDDKPRDTAHRSLSLHTPTGKWLCHRCGARGLLTDALNDALNDALMLDGPTLAPESHEPAKPPATRSFDWHRAWQRSTPLQNSPGAAYLRMRGIPLSLAHAAGVRFAPRWYRRPAVLFPLRDPAGELVAVSGRYLHNPVGAKTITGGAKRLGIFATPGVWRAPRIALTEGPFDALSLALCRLPALALMGTTWPEWLASALRDKELLIATDADPAGDEAAHALEKIMDEAGVHRRRLRPVSDKDWNEVLTRVGRKALSDALRQALV